LVHLLCSSVDVPVLQVVVDGVVEQNGILTTTQLDSKMELQRMFSLQQRDKNRGWQIKTPG